MQVTLVCQAAQKNALMMALQQASVLLPQALRGLSWECQGQPVARSLRPAATTPGSPWHYSFPCSSALFPFSFFSFSIFFLLCLFSHFTSNFLFPKICKHLTCLLIVRGLQVMFPLYMILQAEVIAEHILFPTTNFFVDRLFCCFLLY